MVENAKNCCAVFRIFHFLYTKNCCAVLRVFHILSSNFVNRNIYEFIIFLSQHFITILEFTNFINVIKKTLFKITRKIFHHCFCIIIGNHPNRPLNIGIQKKIEHLVVVFKMKSIA